MICFILPWLGARFDYKLNVKKCLTPVGPMAAGVFDILSRYMSYTKHFYLPVSGI